MTKSAALAMRVPQTESCQVNSVICHAKCEAIFRGMHSLTLRTRINAAYSDRVASLSDETSLAA